MAIPSNNLEVWAKDSLNLPVTGKANKQRPIDDLWSKGYDRGQKPACEEYNYVLNMLSTWTRYILDEGLPAYLPINGTSINFSGDLTGTVTWTGNKIGTGNIQVVDNSHNHLSANITDAAYTPTVNVIPKRGGDGSMTTARSFFGYAPAGGNFDYWFYDQANNTQTGSLAWTRSNNGLNLYLGTASLQRAGVYIYGDQAVSNSGFVNITNPRAVNGQEGQPNSLVRFDYMSQQVNNVQNNLNNYANSANATFVRDIRLGGRTVIQVGGAMVTFPGGCVATSASGDSDADIQAQYAPIQKNINGTWYTVSG